MSLIFLIKKSESGKEITTDIKKIKDDYFVQFHVTKSENLHRFLGKYEWPKLTPEEVEWLKKPQKV